VSELLGLRGRLALALLAISAITLAVTSLLLLFPLDRRLRDDALSQVESTARTARPGLTGLAARDLVPGSPRLAATARALHRRTELDVAFFDARGRLLIATDRDARDRYPEARQALDRDAVVSRFGRGDGRAQAQVALPVRGDGARFAVSFRKSLSDVNGAQDVVQRSLLAAAFVALGAAVAAGIALASRLARRLTALRDVALRVADEGPGSAPVADDGARDEIGDLRRAFATMQRRLDEQEQVRRAFVATASHELRTPLASLRLMLHGAEEDLGGEQPDLDGARDQVQRALGQTIRLGTLAGELLDLSRLDAGLELRREPVELAALARSVVAEFAGRDGARVALAAPDTVWADADPGAAARIVRILLDNALRHAPAGGEVRVAVTAGVPVRLAVGDDGPGVAPADVERVFERFEHGDGGGFGLGLAIGRELARRMGGDLVLHGPGPGATFEVRLPGHDPAA
jgi:signal transduction histidine kinase